MFSSGGTQGQQPEMIKAVRLQTSTYGVVRPLVWGTARVSCNMIWYGDFYAVEQKQDVGGK